MSRVHKIALLIAVLFLLLLASCNSALTTGKANTPSPAPELTATQKATEVPTEIPTLQPSPTVQLQRWDILLPDDSETCKEVNRFSPLDPENPGLLQEELLILL